MAQTLLNPTMVTRKALAILHNKLKFLKTINRQYDDSFVVGGAKVGNTLKIRMPNQFTVRSGLVMDTQDVTEETQDLVVSTVRGVDVNFTSVELTQNIDDFAARILEPAMSRLSAEVEFFVLSNVYQDVYNLSGNTPGGDPATIKAIHLARQKLSQGLAPEDNRHICLDSVAIALLADAVKGLFHQGAEIERAFIEGYIGRGAGFRWWETNLIPNHTNGTRTDLTPVVNTSTGITDGTATIAITGLAASATVSKGDVFTVAGVKSVNLETKQKYASLQQFAVTVAATADGAGALTVSVTPTPRTTGAKLNIVIETAGAGKAVVFAAAGGSGAASTVLTQNLAYHQDAFTFVTADLEQPLNVESSRQMYDGISLSYVRDFDIVNRKHPARFDILFGFKTLRPEWATRVRAE